jgi:hypothetical protein
MCLLFSSLGANVNQFLWTLAVSEFSCVKRLQFTTLFLSNIFLNRAKEVRHQESSTNQLGSFLKQDITLRGSVFGITSLCVNSCNCNWSLSLTLQTIVRQSDRYPLEEQCFFT